MLRRLRFARADWVVLGHGTNVTRVTRGENIFNNKIYIGDLASMSDVRRPAAKYREVPATLLQYFLQLWLSIYLFKIFIFATQIYFLLNEHFKFLFVIFIIIQYFYLIF